jgi:ABC-2 type transport system permease protein
MIAFFVVIFSMTSGSVDNIAMRVCSFIPFTSPVAMFTRIAMGTVELYEIVISIVLLVLSTLGIGALSAKIYRVGVLLYGTPPKLSAIIKTVLKQ